MYSTDEDLNKEIKKLVKDGWNPLADNSDAFRLAADLKINVMFLNWAVKAKLHNSEYETDWIDYGRFNGDVYAATRYAIVVAAAEALREPEEREQRDEALLRQALEALKSGAWDTLRGRNAAYCYS